MLRVGFSFLQNYGGKDKLEAAGDLCLFMGRKAFGYRKASQDTINKIKGSIKHIFLFFLTLPLTSLVSLAGLACISLSKTHREKYHRFQQIAITKPAAQTAQTSSNSSSSAAKSEEKPVVPPEVQTVQPTADPLNKNQAYLDDIANRHRNMYQTNKKPTPLYNLFCIVRMEAQAGPEAYCRPDDNQLSNPILDCLDDPEAYFIPTNSLQHADDPSEYSISPSKPEELQFLKDTLKAAFAVGKKIVVVRLSNSIHAVAAGFSSDGSFKIIDSMGGQAININTLSKQLNGAGIKDSQGRAIQFKGKYVNTHIQKGGHECIRFATLYCYQMFQRKSLKAYQEVNGAFLEGKLKTYEDYKKINDSKKIKSLSSQSKSLYADFMRSWVYRTKAVEQDSWEEIPVQMLPERPLRYGDDGTLGAYCLKKGKLPSYKDFDYLLFTDDTGKEFKVTDFASMPKEQAIPLPGDGLSNTLGSLCDPKEKRLLVFERGNPVQRLYRFEGNSIKIGRKIWPEPSLK